MASCWYNEGMCGDSIGISFYCSVVAHLVPDALASVQDVVQEALQAWCNCEKLEKVDHKGSIVTLNLLGRSRAHAWRLQEFLGLASTCFEYQRAIYACSYGAILWMSALVPELLREAVVGERDFRLL